MDAAQSFPSWRSGAMALCRRKPDNLYIGTLLLFALAGTISAYEKTLRKIVRNQSKMVQRPFGDMSGVLASSDDSVINPLNFQQGSRGSPVRTLSYRTARPIVSLVASLGVNRGHMYPQFTSQAEKPKHMDFRSARNIFPNASKTIQDKYDLFFFEHNSKNHSTWNVQSSSIHRLPFSIFPPANNDDELQTIELTPRTKENILVSTPENLYDSKSNDSFYVKGIFRANLGKDPKHGVEPVEHYKNSGPGHSNCESLKTDNVMEVTTADASSYETYNLSIDGSQICALIKTTRSNIETQKRFSAFNIEPPWMTKNHFWDSIFNRRYEFLMRNPKWPALKVILIPRTHVDTIWENAFTRYNNNSANKMLSNIVKKMNFYTNLTFTWNEICHLSKWWGTATHKSRTVFHKFLKEKRLEITTGCWVESDEATTHIFGLVHNLIQGHQWLADHLSYSPKVGWLTNTVTHGPTMAYLLSKSGITKLIFTNVHYSWEEYFAEYQISDFIWVQNWNNGEFHSSELNRLLKRIGKDRYPSNSIISHYLQFNADGFEACGPNRRLCSSEFDFMGSTKLLDIQGYNIKDKSELLLEQYSKTGTLTPHNIIMAPIGGPHHFETQAEFDYQYNNYLKIAEFTNVNREIYKATMQFGTPSDYFNSIFERNVSYPSLKGDFTNFANVEKGSPSYWSGFFTSRPQLKILLRRIQSTLRSTEMLFSFAVMRSSSHIRDMGIATDIIKLLTKSREAVARLLDRNVVSGNLTANALRYVHEEILLTAKDCWRLQEILISLLTNKTQQKPYVKKYVYRHGEFISAFRTIGPGDHVLMFNSLSHERFEIVEFFSKTPNIRIIDHNEKDVMTQVNPVWKYNSKNVLIISKRFFKIIFSIVIPPLTIELFKIKEAYTTKHHIATIYCVKCTVEEYANSRIIFPFNIEPIEKGDIQLESYKHRLVIDATSGFLKAVVEKDSNTEKALSIDYGAFTSSFVNSGMLFNSNSTKPFQDILMPYRTGFKSKIFMIVTGQLTTEFTSIFGRLLQHTIKIFNLLDNPLSSAIYIESKVDLDVYPNNRDVELFMSIQTDISNGDPPEIYTDNNGFQYTLRTVNTSRRIESNVYPITTLSYIQDYKHRLTVLTDHAQGVTALQEGQLLVMLDKRVLLDKGRNTEEGIASSGASCQRHYILLENFIQGPSKYEREVPRSKALQLPSFRANYLSNTLNYDLDIFIIENNETEHCAHAYFPLINAVFPCDITLLSYRAVVDDIALKPFSKSVTLMVLHRQSFTCRINYDALVHCNVEPEFSIENILENIRSVLKTNLAGTDKGIRTSNINLDNFPPMELLTLRIHF